MSFLNSQFLITVQVRSFRSLLSTAFFFPNSLSLAKRFTSASRNKRKSLSIKQSACDFDCVNCRCKTGLIIIIINNSDLIIMIIWCLLSLLATIFIYDYFTSKELKARLGKQFKGPLALPLIGNLYLYLDKKPEGKSCYQFRETYKQKVKDRFKSQQLRNQSLHL